MEHIKSEIAQLKIDIETKGSVFRAGVKTGQADRNLLAELDSKRNRLESLTKQDSYETRLYDTYRSKFPNLVAETFDALWDSRLREEAFLKDALSRDNVNYTSF
jgi:predicted choloylglycine hydrolase